MKYSFDEKVDRIGFSSVKQAFTPAEITESGIMSMWGAEFVFPTAPFVTEAIVAWAKKGLYAYTVDNDEFHELVRYWMKIQRNWEIEKEWIVPVYGITSSLATCITGGTRQGILWQYESHYVAGIQGGVYRGRPCMAERVNGIHTGKLFVSK